MLSAGGERRGGWRRPPRRPAAWSGGRAARPGAPAGPGRGAAPRPPSAPPPAALQTPKTGGRRRRRCYCVSAGKISDLKKGTILWRAAISAWLVHSSLKLSGRKSAK